MSQTTREERRSALDEFAAATDPSQLPAVSTVNYQLPAEQQHGAIAVAVKRDEGAVLRKIKALAAAAGTDWFYRYPVKNRKENRIDYIEGPSKVLANDVARLYGNCDVDCRPQDLGDVWVFQARFVDLETGFSLSRPFQQRKSAGKIGGTDDERRLEIAFAIGASKAIRNVVVNALQTFADFAFEEARGALVDKIGKELDKYRDRTIERIGANRIDIARVEAVIGRPARDWLAPDVARVIAMMTAVSDGMASADETFPVLATQTTAEKASAALDEFAGQTSEASQASSPAPETGTKTEPEVEAKAEPKVEVESTPEPKPDGNNDQMDRDNREAGRQYRAQKEGERVDPGTGEVIDIWKECVDRILTMVTDPKTTAKQRLETIEQVRPAYEDALPAERAKTLLEYARKIIEGSIKPDQARKYLEVLMFSARDKADCADREVRQRQKVYPRLVVEGRMTGKFADNQIALMQAIADEYRSLAEAEEAKERLL